MTNAITKCKRFFGGRREQDMTQGSIVRNLLVFALPLLVGNLFQQLYNMVDTWVIGQTGITEAYAAVGSVGPIINILIGFFSGLASGAGVVISQHYGMKDEKSVHDAVHTSMLMTFIMAVAFTVIGVLMTPLSLNLMLHAQEDADAIYPYARTYLTIYFAGVAGLMIYNMGAGILRAIGDSQRPFYYLVVSAVTNIVLDLLFVFKFGMGVDGVAYATVIAQGLSAILTVITLLRTTTCVRFRWRDLRMNYKMLALIVRVGFPAAIQMALTAFSNVFVQSYISNVNCNLPADIGGATGKTAALGGWTTYSRVDQFIFLPLQSLAVAITTFVGQNLGIGDVKRAKKGTYIAYLMGVIASIAIMIPVMIFAPTLSAFFNDDPGVVACATILLHDITPFYLFCCVNQIFSASLRGSGNSFAPMLIMLSSFVGFRQLYLWIMSTYISNDLIPIAMSYPAGWGCCCAVILIYFFGFYKFGSARLTKGKEKN